MNFLSSNGLPDWPILMQQFPFMQALEGCPQDVQWHAEGNVFIHTRMVCEALAQMPSYQELSPEDQRLVMTAAIFHDCAKPDVTVMEDGRWRSPSHSRKGMEKLRYHWWSEGGAPPLPQRELILELIRYHAIPIHYIKREHPESAVIDMSQTCRNDLLAILAEADTRGRVTTLEGSQQEAIGMTTMFADIAREYGCLTTPWQFPNDHARFDYFRRKDGNYHYAAHNDRGFTVTMLAGLPGSGKDTWLKENWPEGAPIVSMDALRRELEIDPEDNQGEVVQAAFELARTHLRKKISFAWNATNVTLQMRRKLYDLFAEYGGAIRLVWVDSDRSTLAQRNSKRTKTQVPIKVIERLAHKIVMPNITEVHELLTPAPSFTDERRVTAAFA
ncbi:MAG: AAA family ATPase [Candidatus Methylacidiphilales bacterium]|nr:AAA family ATPase [Candidatus Methylacidiphilales bacterium]